MKTLILILTIISFLQSTVIPIDLVLIILICRSYIKSDKSNLVLAFSFGLFNSLLNLTPIGITSLIYLVLIAATESLSKSRLAGNSLLVIPLTLILMSVNQLIQSMLIHGSVQLFPKVLIETTISLPVFYLIRLWEERFIVKKEIKLRV